MGSAGDGLFWSDFLSLTNTGRQGAVFLFSVLITLTYYLYQAVGVVTDHDAPNGLFTIQFKSYIFLT